MSSSFRETRAFDLLAASPFIVFYFFAVAGIAIKIAPRLSAPFDASGPLDIASQAVTMIFLGVQIVLFIVRRPPKAKSPGLAPRAAAAIGAGIGVAFLALPRAEIAPWLSALSAAIAILGTSGAIVSAASLKRSFSILPQARELVASGPYRYVRHPIYLCEQIAVFGIMLQYRQPLGFLMALVSLAAQFPRMHYEEEILQQTFPEYRTYCERTARLIPKLY